MKANKLQIALVGSALVFASTPAFADVYVKVDANGNAISGAIVCEQSVCGNSNSTYSQLTLGVGEQYVLQGTGTSGIGNNNPNTQVKVDLETNDWTITRTDETQKVISVQQLNPSGVIVNPVIQPVIPKIETTTIITDTATSTAQSDTQTAITQETKTVTTSSFFNNSVMVSEWKIEIKRLINQLLALIARLNK
jgi:hypothetical protein